MSSRVGQPCAFAVLGKEHLQALFLAASPQHRPAHRDSNQAEARNCAAWSEQSSHALSLQAKSPRRTQRLLNRSVPPQATSQVSRVGTNRLSVEPRGRRLARPNLLPEGQGCREYLRFAREKYRNRQSFQRSTFKMLSNIARKGESPLTAPTCLVAPHSLLLTQSGHGA